MLSGTAEGQGVAHNVAPKGLDLVHRPSELSVNHTPAYTAHAMPELRFACLFAMKSIVRAVRSLLHALPSRC